MSKIIYFKNWFEDYTPYITNQAPLWPEDLGLSSGVFSDALRNCTSVVYQRDWVRSQLKDCLRNFRRLP